VSEIVTHSQRDKLAYFGGSPIFKQPLQIVRPRFPNPNVFLAALQAALASGQVTNNARWVVEFERRLSTYLGVPTVVFCSGQIALMTMLRAAGIEGGEVIVPSFTFPATPHAVRWCGAEPVFADISRDTLCLDPEDVERKATSRTVAILGVDAYGVCCDYTSLEEIGRKRGLKVLFDSAPSFGSRVAGVLTGAFGDAQIFSFHASKAFTTMEGGCLCSRDSRIIERAKAIRNFGQSAGGDCVEAGMNGKLTEICALIGLEQLNTFEADAQRRRHAVLRLRQGIENIPGLKVGSAPSNQESIWLYLPVVIEARSFGVNRDDLVCLFAKEGLHVRKYYSPPCHHMTAYARARDQKLPITEQTAANVIALPIYNDMTEEECDGIIQAFSDIHRLAPRIINALRCGADL
jgi:dTDP-4-amino-4,6-dideoxy-D-glucose transaminase